MLVEIQLAHGAKERSTMEVEDQKVRLGLAHDSMRSMETAAKGFEEVGTYPFKYPISLVQPILLQLIFLLQPIF